MILSPAVRASLYSYAIPIGDGRLSYSSTLTTSHAGTLSYDSVNNEKTKLSPFSLSHTSIFDFQVLDLAIAKRQLKKKQKHTNKQHDHEPQHCQQYDVYSTHDNPSSSDLCDDSIRFVKSVDVFADCLPYSLYLYERGDRL